MLLKTGADRPVGLTEKMCYVKIGDLNSGMCSMWQFVNE